MESATRPPWFGGWPPSKRQSSRAMLGLLARVLTDNMALKTLTCPLCDTFIALPKACSLSSTLISLFLHAVCHYGSGKRRWQVPSQERRGGSSARQCVRPGVLESEPEMGPRVRAIYGRVLLEGRSEASLSLTPQGAQEHELYH